MNQWPISLRFPVVLQNGAVDLDPTNTSLWWDILQHEFQWPLQSQSVSLLVTQLLPSLFRPIACQPSLHPMCVQIPLAVLVACSSLSVVQVWRVPQTNTRNATAYTRHNWHGCWGVFFACQIVWFRLSQFCWSPFTVNWFCLFQVKETQWEFEEAVSYWITALTTCNQHVVCN